MKLSISYKAKWILVSNLLSIVALNFLGCQLYKLPPIQVVPSSACFALSIHWQEVRNDDFLKKSVKGDEIEKSFNRLNISNDKVSELAIFSDTAIRTDGNSGIIING